MTVNFSDATAFGSFFEGANVADTEQKFARNSEITLGSLRDSGLLDNVVIQSTSPATNKLWLDTSIDPPKLKVYSADLSAWVLATFNNVFGGSSSVSPIANSLEWTPVLSDAEGNIPDHNLQEGRYCMMGNRIFINWILQLSNKTGLLSGSHLRINGLPFPVSDVDNAHRGGAIVNFYVQANLGSFYGISGQPWRNTSYILLYKNGNTGIGQLRGSDVNPTVSLHGFGTYIK